MNPDHRDASFWQERWNQKAGQHKIIFGLHSNEFFARMLLCSFGPLRLLPVGVHGRRDRGQAGARLQELTAFHLAPVCLTTTRANG